MTTIPGNKETLDQEMAREDAEKKGIISNPTRPFSTPKAVDDFDVALDNEIQRTSKAEQEAEYNRKKYGQAKDRIRELQQMINEKDKQLE